MWLPYVWLSLAMVSLWIAGSARLAVAAALLGVAIVHAYVNGIVTPAALLPIAAFGLLASFFYESGSPEGGPHRKAGQSEGGHHDGTGSSTATKVVAGVAVVLFSLALMAHVLPGFHNLLIVKDVVLSPGAVPYTLYLNFDKAFVGLFLLAFGPPLLSSRTQWGAMLAMTIPRVVVLLVLVAVCAMWIGHVRLEPKWPAFLPFWVWANLLFTCAAEEALFRSVIQRHLQGERAFAAGQDAAVSSRTGSRRGLTGLAIASVLFGVAHFAGGLQLILMATLAGVGYGWMFWRTGRIEASILTHFLVNFTHLLFFTYPARG
jgi:membrane protease YdiL (CAAX protease family)